MNTKYFENITTIEELKKKFKQLAMELHPDHGGSAEEFKSMYSEYEKLIPLMNTANGEKMNEEENLRESAEAAKFKEIIDILLNLDGVAVELCGNWLWISGKTRENKASLKALGCKWAPKKMQWYWMPPEERSRRHYRGNKTMSEIRNKYGSMRFKKREEKKTITA